MQKLRTEMDSPGQPDLSFLHLQVELIRIDILILRAVRRWQQAHQSQDATDVFQGHYISDTEIEALLAQPLGVGWWHGSSPKDHEDVLEQATRRAVALSETAQQKGEILRLEHLASVFGLNQFELEALLICLAPAFDRRYERFYGYLQDDATRKWPSVSLILDLLCEPGPDRLLRLAHFADNAPLLHYRLLAPVRELGMVEPALLNQALRPDKAIVAWLLGSYQPHAMLGSHATLVQPRHRRPTAAAVAAHAMLGSHATLVQPQDSETDRLLAWEMVQSVQHVVDKQAPIFVFYGSDKVSQQAAARLLAARVGRPLLMVNLEAAMQSGLSSLDALGLALRDARLTGAILCLFGWDVCLVDGTPPPETLARLCDHPDLVMVAGRERWQPREIVRRPHMVWLDFPNSPFTRRYTLWTHFLGPTAVTEDLDVTSLATQFTLTASQIRDAVAAAQDMAIQRGTPLQSSDLFAAARAHSNPRLSALACKINPRYDWQDIILPEDSLVILHELAATVRGRSVVLDEWGLSKKLASSAGITALFAGPPGTGKTMAAEVIARELGLDLYKIDLSTVVSKYIGETEKNLAQIFNEAESSNAILFFDEADALFGKRSEVHDSHDRYANIEISYLLQRMEAYDGVAILATNLRANLDEAFTRRLQFVVDLPFPDEADRLRIWQTLFPSTIPHDPEIDMSLLARRFKLTGGNIRNIIVSAAYLAAADGGEVTMDHLLHGTRRELQKMGRLVGETDFRW
jgi:hypothetical protein